MAIDKLKGVIIIKEKEYTELKESIINFFKGDGFTLMKKYKKLLFNN